MKSRIQNLLAFFWLLMGPVAAQSTSEVAPQIRSQMNIAFDSEFDSLHPFLDSTLASKRIRDAVHRRLVYLSPKGQYESTHLEKVPTLSNGLVHIVQRPDGNRGMVLTLNFKKNAQWGDQKPVTCEDLQFALEVGMAKTVSNTKQTDFAKIEKIEIINGNPKSCRVELKQLAYDYMYLLPDLLPKHLEKEIFESKKKDPFAYDRNTLYVTSPGNPGLYTGPYRVLEWKYGSHITLVRNENFFGAKAKIERLNFRFITNSASLEPALLSRQVDMIASSLPMEQILSLEKKVKEKNLPYKVVIKDSPSFAQLTLNLSHPFLQERQMRLALVHAIDRKKISDAFFAGRQKPAISIGNSLNPWYPKNGEGLEKHDFNPRKSIQLIQKLGWVQGEGGYFFKDGKKLTLIASSVVDQKLNDVLLIFLQDAFKKIGVDLQVKMAPARVFFAELFKKRKFELALSSWTAIPDWNPKDLLYSRFIPTAENAWTGFNRSGIQNQDLDRLLEQYEVELDDKKRHKLMHKALKIVNDEVPTIPLYIRAVNVVIPDHLKGFELSPHSDTEYNQVENWSL